jgi:nicotinic acid phosphoribosyltransferase
MTPQDPSLNNYHPPGLSVESATFYYVDFLAILAGLLHGPPDYFSDSRLIVRQTPIPILFAGARHAANYLRSFRFSDELNAMLGSHPIFKKLKVPTHRLLQLMHERAYYDFQFAQEGYQLEPETIMLKLIGSTFCTSVILNQVESITQYQSSFATGGLKERQKFKAWIGNHPHALMDIGVVRAPTATHTAYLSYASRLAGGESWVIHKLNAKPESLASAESDAS